MEKSVMKAVEHHVGNLLELSTISPEHFGERKEAIEALLKMAKIVRASVSSDIPTSEMMKQFIEALTNSQQSASALASSTIEHVERQAQLIHDHIIVQAKDLVAAQGETAKIVIDRTEKQAGLILEALSLIRDLAHEVKELFHKHENSVPPVKPISE